MGQLKWIVYLFFTLGVGLLAGAGFVSLHGAALLAEGARAEGTVVELVREVRSANGRQRAVYAPVVRYTTGDGETLEFQSRTFSAPPAYQPGDTVTVLYRPEAPLQASIEGFAEQWTLALVLGGIGSVFVLVSSIFLLVGPLARRREAHLRRHGVAIDTELQGVERNLSLRVQGRSPFRVVTQWLNPATGEIHVFKSENLWFDPTPYIEDRKIRVLIERGNPRRYHVDLSFLPKMAA